VLELARPSAAYDAAVKVARMASTARWRSKRGEFVGIIMAGSLSSAIEILDAGVGQGPVRLDE
jgi:hypothetical protein